MFLYHRLGLECHTLKKSAVLFIVSAMFIFFLEGCSYFETDKIQNVGVLFESTIENNLWNQKGYDGLQDIEEEYDVDIFYAENMNNEQEISRKIDEFAEDGVNLIFGHSNSFGSYFTELSELYPDIQFVYFNGSESADNVTSLSFDSHAMGFFGGMVAGEMTATNEVGIIAAFSWQPEIEGFYEGVKYANPSADIEIKYTYDWNDTEKAMNLYEEMRGNGTDVIYPAGEAYTSEVIREADEDGLFAIGYTIDQMENAPKAVLTSTIQHVDKLYLHAAEMMEEGSLEGAVETFDFKDGYITLGEFNDVVPQEFQQEIEGYVENYIETGLLPNES